jgi:ankyrin repeat protein
MSAPVKPAKKEDTPNLRILKAAERGDLELLKTAITNGADIHTTDDGQNTPLHLASYRGHAHIVQYLLSMLVPTFKPNGYTCCFRLRDFAHSYRCEAIHNYTLHFLQLHISPTFVPDH